MSFPNIIFGREGAQYEIHATQADGMGRHPWGTILVTPSGRQFRYARAGGTIPAGNLVQSEIPEANWDELAVDIPGIGTKVLSVTLGATAMDLNEVAQGYLNVEDDTGEGYAYRIANHLAIASAGTGNFNLDTGVKLAFVAATTVGVHKNPYRDFIIHASVNTALLLGVTQMAVVAGDCCWLQTKGPCSVLIDGTVIIGLSVMASNATDGSVEAWGLTEAAPPTEITPIVGHVIEVAATTEFGMIELKLD